MFASEARKAIELFFEGFNAEDDAIIRRALNYPHVRLASGTVRVWNAPEDFQTPFAALKQAENWHHSTLDHVDVLHDTPDKVHFAVRFSRYLENGDRYALHEAIWIVTRLDDHWGIQARSSFAP